MKLEFRSLRAEEIEVRVSTVNAKGCSLLLYKDARCDQNILDETVGALNWQRHHNRDNANCIVSIWDEDKQQWIEKEDVGTESYTEKEKGLASDSFKRACFNWGIGRELYTAPFIWVGNDKVTLSDKGGKQTTYDKFSVSSIEIEEGRIVALEIYNDNMRKVAFKLGKTAKKSAPKTDAQADEQATVDLENKPLDGKYLTALIEACKKGTFDSDKICSYYQVSEFRELKFKDYKYIATHKEEFK